LVNLFFVLLMIFASFKTMGIYDAKSENIVMKESATNSLSEVATENEPTISETSTADIAQQKGRHAPIFDHPNGPKFGNYVRGFVQNGRYQLSTAGAASQAKRILTQLNQAAQQNKVELDKFTIYGTKQANDPHLLLADEYPNTKDNEGALQGKDIVQVVNDLRHQIDRSKKPKIYLEANDTVQGAISFADRFLDGDTSKIAILDHADANLAGAGPLFYADASTQEEAMLRQTDGFMRLNWIQDRYQGGFFDLPELGVIFLRDVKLLDPRTKAVTDRKINIVASALYDYQGYGNIPSGYNNYVHKDMAKRLTDPDHKVGKFISSFAETYPLGSQQYIKNTRAKIRAILASTADQGIRNIVIGAIGTGAFGNPQTIVAQAYKEVLFDEGFASLFDNIVFVQFGNVSPVFESALQ
jgi:hypothetical protein